MADDVLLAFSTFPDLEAARRMARALVEGKLVACANIIPQIESIYRWKGNIETSNEVLVYFKLPATGYATFERKLKELHPYDVPEIIAVEIAQGLPEYLRWAAESVESQSNR